ncbi:MAG: NOP5/NOP56 family protein [Candidatus ainarchaeum sp.]|nr:NOP5/NOP56 family protein [Candidatus ainarchaeum sp.]
MNRIEELRKKLIKKTREKVEEKYSGEEEHIIRAVNALQDLDEIFNLLSEHCAEWYSSHFPELGRALQNPEAFLKLIYFVGEKEKFSEKAIADIIKEPATAKLVIEKAKKSMGSKIPETAMAEIKMLALNALNIREQRNSLEKFLTEEMQKKAPNFSQICGSVLGAKMLKEAGSLRRLALMPSSTIQILGAKKAFFRHVKNPNAKTPKYGLLFQHPMVKQASFENKGKLARSLAGKISIAIKMDFFGKKEIAKELQKGLDERAKQLQKQK